MKKILCLFASLCLCLLIACCETRTQTMENSIDFFAMGYDEAIEFANNANISIILVRDIDEVYYSENLNVTLGEKYES